MENKERAYLEKIIKNTGIARVIKYTSNIVYLDHNLLFEKENLDLYKFCCEAIELGYQIKIYPCKYSGENRLIIEKREVENEGV